MGHRVNKPLLITLLKYAICITIVNIVNLNIITFMMLVIAVNIFIDYAVHAIENSRKTDSINSLLVFSIRGIIITGLITGIYILMNILIENGTNTKFLMTASLVTIGIVELALFIFNTTMDNKDEVDITIELNKVIDIYEDFNKYYGQVLMRADIDNTESLLRKIRSILNNLTTLCISLDASSIKALKDRAEFILLDFNEVYNSYGGKLIVQSEEVANKYNEYLVQVKNNLEELASTAINSNVGNVQEAIDKLKSLNELSGLEEKYK